MNRKHAAAEGSASMNPQTKPTKKSAKAEATAKGEKVKACKASLGGNCHGKASSNKKAEGSNSTSGGKRGGKRGGGTLRKHSIHKKFNILQRA